MSHPRRLSIAGNNSCGTGLPALHHPTPSSSRTSFHGSDSPGSNAPSSHSNNQVNPAYSTGRPYRSIVNSARTKYSSRASASELAVTSEHLKDEHGHDVHAGSASPAPNGGASPSPIPARMGADSPVSMPSPPRTPPGLRIAVPSPAPQAHAPPPASYNVLPAIEKSHRYVITGTLQQSLFGIVKMGFDRKCKRQVAIKVSRRELANSSQARSGVTVLENVRREAEVMRYLGNQHASMVSQLNGGLDSEKALPGIEDMHIDSGLMKRQPWEHGESDDERDMSRGADENGMPILPILLSPPPKDPSEGCPEGAKFVCHLIEELEDEHFHYLISEFVPGGDLYSILTSIPNHRVDEDQGRAWFRQIVLGMKFMHQNHVAHLDMSLENIVLDEVDNVKIIDFGVGAVHPLCPSSSSLTNYFSLASSSMSTISFTKGDGSKGGSAVSSFLCKPVVQLHNKPGKIRYMSPELYGNQAWDAYKNDIFSLGVILYSLLTGRPPFQHSDPSDIWFHVIYSSQWLTPSIMQQASASVYTHLSEEALNLLDSIIKPQAVRPSLDQILSHPWLNKTSNNPNPKIVSMNA